MDGQSASKFDDWSLPRLSLSRSRSHPFGLTPQRPGSMRHSDGNAWRENSFVGVVAELGIVDEAASDGTPGCLAQESNGVSLYQGIRTRPSPFFSD